MTTVVRLVMFGLCCIPGCSPGPKPRGATTAPASHQRIIAFAPSSAEIIAAIGAVDRLVGVGTFCTHPPEVAVLPKIGGQFDPDLEGIVRLQPDLVVLRGGNHEVEQLCAAQHITIYKDPTETLGTLHDAIRGLGQTLERSEAAEAVIRRMQDRLKAVAGAVAERPRPRVFVAISRRDPDSLAGVLTASDRTFMGELITMAGGENVFGRVQMDYPEVSPEAIVAAAPEIIVEAMPEAEPDLLLSERVRTAWRRLGPVPAVSAGRIHVLTDDNTLIPSPRVVEVVAKLARLLHPEAVID